MDYNSTALQRATHKQFTRYFVVSVMSLFLNAIVFAVIYQGSEMLAQGLQLLFVIPSLYLTAEFVAILIVTVFNFVLNRYWSFEIREKERAGRHFIKYAIVGAIGTFVNLGVLWILSSLLEIPKHVAFLFVQWSNPLAFGISAYSLVHLTAATFCASVAYLAAMINNFTLNKWWTFEQPPQAWLSFRSALLEQIRPAINTEGEGKHEERGEDSGGASTDD
jgi:putative flippase GtrA